jgi:hypothetical protein
VERYYFKNIVPEKMLSFWETCFPLPPFSKQRIKNIKNNNNI